MPTVSDQVASPSSSYGREISRALWFRKPETRCRFLLAAADPEGLVIAPLGPKGTQTMVDAAKRLQAAGHRAVAGAMLVDADGDLVFCLTGEPQPFLHSLAGWAADRVAAIPALGALRDAGAARLAAPLGGDPAVEALDPAQLEVVRDPAAWDGLVRAGLLGTDDASVAAILADRLPGERMWFWMSDAVPGDMAPLLLQPVAWDPNRDRLDAQIRRLEADGAGDGVTGYAFITEAGRLQFVSGGLRLGLMPELADWVRQQAAACPALARLAGCQFALVEGGRVVDVLEAPALWDGVAAPPAPGTLAAAAAALAALAPGEAQWLWLTAAAPGGGFVALAPVAGDAAGAAFAAQVAGFYRRFPDSYRDAVTGTVRRDAGGTLRIDWHGSPADAAQALMAAARQEPGLQALADAGEG